MQSTREVLDHHLKCFGDGDLPGLLSDYGPDAVLFTPQGPLRGVNAIGPFFRAMMGEPPKAGAVFRMTQRAVEGDYAYLLWSKGSATDGYEMGTDALVVRDGKIVAQSLARWNSPTG